MKRSTLTLAPEQCAIHTCRRSEFGPRLPNWMQGLPNKRRKEKYLNQDLQYLVGANSPRGDLMRRSKGIVLRPCSA